MIDNDGVRLHIDVGGSGADILVLSGGPGCVHYLAHDELLPEGMRAWCPEPRGVGRSGGGAHTMAEAVADLELVRSTFGIDSWVVLGHSWGSDLAVRYALDCPESVSSVVGIAGHGLHKDRTWSKQYEAGIEPDLQIPWEPVVWQSLQESFIEWIHEPQLFRQLADSPVPMTFLAAADDIRPSWPLHQLAALVPNGHFGVVDGVAHNFWQSHPDLWRKIVTEACAMQSPPGFAPRRSGIPVSD
ncbi:alpha/beta hydrolase [Rhodococcus sp. IEGM 1409]|uniref:alpha/beta fold hydrolase n=1 Tax=Rhodococcus sp. IEGM 1409 TaxID=3047082 RepID=UPI0024B73C4E|nr:alpha/beta hydrolase [Rhodococcus sp. IEGM 1409]